jgi:hypothetical protein
MLLLVDLLPIAFPLQILAAPAKLTASLPMLFAQMGVAHRTLETVATGVATDGSERRSADVRRYARVRGPIVLNVTKKS